jgi:hypothetical protein
MIEFLYGFHTEINNEMSLLLVILPCPYLPNLATRDYEFKQKYWSVQRWENWGIDRRLSMPHEVNHWKSDWLVFILFWSSTVEISKSLPAGFSSISPIMIIACDWLLSMLFSWPWRPNYNFLSNDSSTTEFTFQWRMEWVSIGTVPCSILGWS